MSTQDGIKAGEKDDDSKESHREAGEDLDYLLSQINPIQTIDDGDTIVIFSTRNNIHYKYIYTFYSYITTEHGFPTFFFFYDERISKVFPNIRVGSLQLTNSLIQNEYPLLYRSGQISYPHYTWNIDLENETINPKGLEDCNYFHTIQATLRREFQRYNLDFGNPDVSRALQRALFTADEISRYMELLTGLARRRNLDVKIIGWEVPYLPNGLFYELTKSVMTEDRMDFILLSPSKAHYFGSINDYAKRLSCSNITARGTSDPKSGFKREFLEFRRDLENDPERFEAVQKEVKEDLDRVILPGPAADRDEEQIEEIKEKQEDLMELVEEYKDDGKMVFTLYSHVFYDVGLYDDSPAYHDMCEWISHTVELFKDREDLLILKPHPAETEHALDQWNPNERLKDYLESKYDYFHDNSCDIDNIILMDVPDFGAYDLYQLQTCGLVWRSSVGIEMACLGLPHIVAGQPRYGEYMDLTQIESREEYEREIDRADQQKPSKELQTQAALYLNYTKNHQHTDFPYIINIDYSALDPVDMRWHQEKIDEFTRNGDEAIERLLLDELNPREDEEIDESEFDHEIVPDLDTQEPTSKSTS